jgi:hypothetical protein
MSTRTLSNLTTLETLNTVTNILTTTAAGGLINVDAKSLSNVTTVETANLTTAAAGGLINVSGKTLSNVTAIETAKLTTAAAGGLIDVSYKSLSNIDLVKFNKAYGTDVIATTVTVDTMTTSSARGIDFAANTLSNIAIVDAAKLTYTLGPNINVDGKTLSNVASPDRGHRPHRPRRQDALQRPSHRHSKPDQPDGRAH